MDENERQALGLKSLCHECVGDAFLAEEMERAGRARHCSYCGRRGKGYRISEMADRVEEVFQRHYALTLGYPDGLEASLHFNRESDYEWERAGEPVVDAIMNSADMPEEAAQDIQRLLEDRYADFEAAQIGEETEFSSDTHYEETGTDDREWQAGWSAFERSLKTEARFFSHQAVQHLRTVFANIEDLITRDGRAMVTDAGPGTALETLYRARAFQAVEQLEAALCRPDLHLGPPPARVARAGRMNALGISVFYGATDAQVAVAEVRPPVGSRVAVGRFHVIRPLRLLDLTALGAVASGGSVYDPDLAPRLERAMFLRSLSERMTRPVMPDDEAFEYLPTQAIADFLATEAAPPLDGILFPSVQAADGSSNVVLFHKAARVEAMSLPAGTEIEARSWEDDDEGGHTEYVVVEETPPAPAEAAAGESDDSLDWGPGPVQTAWSTREADARDATLRLDLNAIDVHHVQRVQYQTEDHHVQRLRWEKRDRDLF